jgi:pimeloyl-ACP methyl ester carboxylesterase
VRVDEHTIDVGGTPVFYRGAGDAPILYLHGIPTSSDDWLPFLERIGGVAPDLLGFGRSGKGGHLDYSLEGHADFVEVVLDCVPIDEPFGLVAHGWGAGAGLVFAQRHPDRVASMVLLNPLPLFEDISYGTLERVWRTRAIGELTMGFITKRLLGRRLSRGSVTPGAWPAQRVATAWDHFDQGTQRAILRLYRSADPEDLAAAGAELDAITAPTLIVWGERDPWFPSTYAGRYAEQLPDARGLLVPNAGHWPWLDDDSVLDAVERHLAGG